MGHEAALWVTYIQGAYGKRVHEQLRFPAHGRPYANGPEGLMNEDEYWVDLCQHDAVLGGGFFITRFFVMTLLECVQSLDGGSTLVLELAGEEPVELEGRVVDLQPEAGLALILVVAPPSQVLPTPRMDHVVKGDDWLAPYTPPRVRRPLRGTVDGVVHDHAQDAPCRTTLQLVLDGPAKDYSAFGGGPVERATEDTEQTLVGVLMGSGSPRSAAPSAPDGMIATAIDSAMEAFPGLSALSLAQWLTGTGLPPAHPATAAPSEEAVVVPGAGQAHGAQTRAGTHPQSSPVCTDGGSSTATLDISPKAEVTPWSPQDIRDPAVAQLCARTEDSLKFLDHLGDSGLVDPLDLDAFRLRLLDDLTEALGAHGSLGGDKGGEEA